MHSIEVIASRTYTHFASYGVEEEAYAESNIYYIKSKRKQKRTKKMMSSNHEWMHLLPFDS